MRKYNSVFSGGNPSWANACVGDNGSPGYWEYAKGFSVAANILIDATLDEERPNLTVDEMIYPVCFNMRHSIELRIKWALGVVSAILKYKKIITLRLKKKEHDIGSIWTDFKLISETFDDRLAPLIERLSPFIQDIADIDPTGQTFRYPRNIKNKKHLVDVSVINFFILREKFREIEELFDEMHRLIEYLYVEYESGTFTKHLSRQNILDIAKTLPRHSQWSSAEFDETKQKICNKYSISNKEFSKCIDFIKNNFEMAPLIGLKVPLLGVNEEDIRSLFSVWHRHKRIYLNHSLKSVDSSELATDYKKYLKDLSRRNKLDNAIWSMFGQHLSVEKIAGYSALFYFARELGFSENYHLVYKIQFAETQGAAKSGEIQSAFFHIFQKLNLVKNILRSLYFLRFNQLAENLVSEFQLESSIDWLDDARKLKFAPIWY